MFLPLAHTKLDVYKVAGELLVSVYRLTLWMPSDEKFNLVSQVRRAALSIKLNIAEGASRKTVPDRKRFFEIARSSVVEIDAAIGVAVELKYFTGEQMQGLGELITRTHSMLSKMISNS